jgi:hypothetical protein
MGPNETKKLLHSKTNGHQIEEVSYGMGEKHCQLSISQGINNQNILKSQEISDPLKKLENNRTEIFQRMKFMANI